MKTILGLKNKANAMAKERLEGRANRPIEITSLKPFEAGLQTALGFDDANKEASQNSSRASSPRKAAQKPPPQGRADIDPVLESLVQNERREAVKEEFFKETPDAYTVTHHLNIKAATYNVNGRRPPESLDLSPWLDLGSHPADIIAIGFQEVVPLTAQNIMLGASLEASADWERLLDVCLNGAGEREEGHLVPKGAAEPQASSSPAKKAATQDRLLIPDSAHPSQTHTEAEASDRDGGEALSPRSTETGTGDELEGYLSPAEDTFSVLSDDHIAAKSYVQVVGKQMVGVYLTIWVKRSLLKHIRGIQTMTLGTGVMYLGNKGAVMARMRVFDSGIAFVSSHLASGEQEGDDQKRNADYQDIMRRAAFPTDAESLEPDSLSKKMGGPTNGLDQSGSRATGQWGNQQGLLEMNHLIWMGDLNYRLNAPDSEARNLVKSGNWSVLATKDQLTIARREKRAFQGWEEGPLNFPPTFKFKRGTSIYLGAGEEEPETAEPPQPSSTGASAANGQKQEVEKKRTPAWTDRVLWHTKGGLRQTSYGSANLFVSDHKPVVADFSFVAREYDRAKVQSVLEAAKSAVHDREAASVPRCELEPHTIEAGTVTFAREKIVTTVLRNQGQVQAEWKFVPISGFVAEKGGDQEHRIAPRWAKVNPEKGYLNPGEAIEITVTIWIDGGKDGSADYLVSEMKSKLDAIILLRIEGGNDVFCSIVGSVMPSFFGLSLTTLAGMPRPLDPAEGWESGSPKLRINTQRKQRRQQASDSIPADFYSPMTAIEEPSFDEASELESRTKQDSRQISRRGSLEATEGPSQTQHVEVNGAGLSSVDQMFEAFSVQGQAADPEHVQQSSNQSSPLRQNPGDGPLVPPELVAIVEFLQAQTEVTALISKSAEWARIWEPQRPQSYQRVQERRKHSPGVYQIRRALDQGREVPANAESRFVAAALVAYFLALPEPLLPMKALSSQHQLHSRQTPFDRLAAYVPPADLAVLQYVTDFLKHGLKAANTQDQEAIAELFAYLWFEATLKPREESSDERDNSEDLARRTEFVSSLLQS